MQHIEASLYTYAKGACYRCGATSDLVDFDAHIEGEGALCICSTCVFEAAALARIGRAKMRRKDREAERERAHLERNDDGADAAPQDLSVFS